MPKLVRYSDRPGRYDIAYPSAPSKLYPYQIEKNEDHIDAGFDGSEPLRRHHCGELHNFVGYHLPLRYGVAVQLSGRNKAQLEGNVRVLANLADIQVSQRYGQG